MPTKVHIVKAMVFPVTMHGCESWTIKKDEHWRTDAFELWCWRRLESCLDYKEIKSVNPKVLNIHWKDRCWSWSSSTLDTWWEELTHWKRPWCWERLKAGGKGDGREWDGWMASLRTLIWASSRSWWWTWKPGMLQSLGFWRVGPKWVTELNWKTRVGWGKWVKVVKRYKLTVIKEVLEMQCTPWWL